MSSRLCRFLCFCNLTSKASGYDVLVILCHYMMCKLLVSCIHVYILYIYHIYHILLHLYYYIYIYIIVNYIDVYCMCINHKDFCVHCSHLGFGRASADSSASGAWHFEWIRCRTCRTHVTSRAMASADSSGAWKKRDVSDVSNVSKTIDPIDPIDPIRCGKDSRQ